MTDFLDIFIHSNYTIKNALSVIDNSYAKIALVVNENNKLLGTLNDGDVRRGLLKNKSLSDTVVDLYNRNPTVASEEDSPELLSSICLKNRIKAIPILDSYENIVSLFILEEELNNKNYDNEIILMVGGLGSRLKALTHDTPKPMLKVGGKPILETIINGFVNSGFKNVTMCVGYKSDVIQNYFQDGRLFGANIKYIFEEKRMGTAGALTLLMKKPNKSFFVMNGDLLTNVDFEKMLEFHKSNESKGTMCVREYDFTIPYGVVTVLNEEIISIEEKPVSKFFINAGIYILEPEAVELIPDEKFFDMPSLFGDLMGANEKVCSFPISEYWIDIGRLDDYERANNEYSLYF